MKSIFKVMAVLIMAASVSFMGVSIAAYFGRAEPFAEMQSSEMQGYNFERGGGAKPTWTVTRRTGDKGSVGTFSTGYEALVKAHKDYADSTNRDGQTDRDAVSKLRAQDGQLAVFTASQAMDTKAVDGRITELQEFSRQDETELLKKSEELQSLSVKSKVIRDETALRRTDVVRLSNELEEVRTDVFRLAEQRRLLTDQLLRLQLDSHSLAERRVQLQKQSAQ